MADDRAGRPPVTTMLSTTWASVLASSGFRASFYPTPAAAVPPLILHLRGVRTFAEPCCGDGALVRHPEARGLRCSTAKLSIITGGTTFPGQKMRGFLRPHRPYRSHPRISMTWRGRKGGRKRATRTVMARTTSRLSALPSAPTH